VPGDSWRLGLAGVLARAVIVFTSDCKSDNIQLSTRK
jgi:hypothetical protein